MGQQVFILCTHYLAISNISNTYTIANNNNDNDSDSNIDNDISNNNNNATNNKRVIIIIIIIIIIITIQDTPHSLKTRPDLPNTCIITIASPEGLYLPWVKS